MKWLILGRMATTKLAHNQGDQIERILAHWVIVYFGQCFENHRSSAHFWAAFFHGAGYVLI
jgi:hypothetical protein